jgi:hypothetical protein
MKKPITKLHLGIECQLTLTQTVKHYIGKQI